MPIPTETTSRDRNKAVLRDVIRSGGNDCWSHLTSHGHSFSTVWACVRRGLLSAPSRYKYEITKAGREEADHG